MTEFIVLFLIFYAWHAMGITIGYHRLLSHRSFVCSKPVEYFWAFPAYMAFEGSPIWWSTMHRAHHKHSDTPLDPHSPKNGYWQAQFGWLTAKVYPSHIDPAVQSKDLLKDPVYRFLEQGGNLQHSHVLGFAFCFLFRAIIWLCFGWVAALASLAAGLAVLQVPLLLNVVCHMPKLGYKTYANSDDSVNVWWVGILAMGEGWHNNHHAAPGSAKTGMRWWELDLSWCTIVLMRTLGLVREVNVGNPTKFLLPAAAPTGVSSVPPLSVASVAPSALRPLSITSAAAPLSMTSVTPGAPGSVATVARMPVACLIED